MTAIAFDIATTRVLWWRDIKKFWRQPSRIIGALGQPVIFWLVIGSGMAATFKIPNVDVGYLSYFFPGVVMMVLLFASIFASVSVIDDRHQGFLQSVLVGPSSRGALVFGKCLGAASVANIQALLFLALAPLAGFDLLTINWPLLAATMLLSSLGLTAMGFAVAWLLDNTQGYHAIQMTLLIPMWVVSGAMFPPNPEHPVFSLLMTYNPVAYGVSGMRHAMHGDLVSAATVLSPNPWSELGVVAGFAVVMLGSAMLVCSRRT